MVAVARPRQAAPRAYSFPPFGEEVLENGIRLMVCPIPKLPLITLLVVINSGAAADPKGKEGLARLTAKSLVEGTPGKSGIDLSGILEGLGTSLESGADWDSSVLKTTFLAEHLDRVLPLLCEVLIRPTFPERELQRLKAERIADLVQIESEPRALADQKFEAFLYSAESRYSIPSGGSHGSISALAREDLVQFHAQRYAPASTTVIAVGDITLEELQPRLRARLGNWNFPAKGGSPPRNILASVGRTVRIVDKTDAPQSELRVGHAGLERIHPDYFPAVVMNAVLGGLFGSRINLNLREAHGYTYGASSYFDWRRDAGPFVISTAVQTEVTGAALKEIFLEIDRIRAEEIMESELSLAKEYLDGVFPIRYETTGSIAAALANMRIYGLPRDYYDTYRENIRRVSSAEVLCAARSHVQPEQMQVVIVGNTAALRGSVEELRIGPIEVASD
jgi:zinc protease